MPALDSLVNIQVKRQMCFYNLNISFKPVTLRSKSNITPGKKMFSFFNKKENKKIRFYFYKFYLN